MPYFSKETILKAYKALSTLSTDPLAQGATQRVSAIRYFLALDMFYKSYNRPCDTQDKNDAAKYIENVGKVVSVTRSLYTANFYYPLKENADYAVGSNFYSVNVVHESVINGGEQLIFPRRGGKPLINIKSGLLYEEKSLIPNLKTYIVSDELRSALVLWLLRVTKIGDGQLYTEVHEALGRYFTQDTITELLPPQNIFDAVCQKMGVSCSTPSAEITENDIKALFPGLKTKNGNSESVDSLFDNVDCAKYIDFLKVKHNIVLTGAPGTGKTWLAKAIAHQMNAVTEFVQFHPSYDYTDFVEGIRPKLNGGEEGGDSHGAVSFERKDGIFKRFCKNAVLELDNAAEDARPYVFIIDEINRGELSKIFGELFFAIDPNYRGKIGMVTTQYQELIDDDTDLFKNGFYIPENVYIIGTMNDIDRSVDSMDFAVRRRFAWKEITASMSADNMGLSEEVKTRMSKVNEAIEKCNLTSDYHIGGAYFLKLEGKDYEKLWEDHIKGLVEEYFRGNPDGPDYVQTIHDALVPASE